MKPAIIIAVAVLLSALTLAFGYYGYPVKGINDAAAYLVPAIQMAQTGELANPILWTGTHALHSGQFLVHMPFFQIFLNFFISPSDVPLPVQAFIVIATINVAVIAFSAWALYLIGAMGERKLDWLAVLIISAALFLIFRASWSFGGRPETLMRLFFTVGFLFALKIRRSSHLAVALGVLLGAIAATHVSGYVFFSALIGFVFAVKGEKEKSLLDIFSESFGEGVASLSQTAGGGGLIQGGSARGEAKVKKVLAGLGSFGIGSWKSFQHTALAVGVGILAFVTIMQLSPYSITATYKTIFRQAEFTAPLTLSFGRNVLSVFNSPYVFLYAVIGISLAFFAVRVFLRAVKEKRVESPLLVVLSAVVALALVAFVLVNGFRMYHIAPFLLLLLAAFLYYVTRVPDSKFVKYSIGFLFLALVFVSLKPVALFPSFLKDGKTLPVARAEFGKILEKNLGVPIRLGGGRMWALSEEYSRMVEGELPEGLGSYLYVLEEETHPELSAELDFDSCVLGENFYTEKVPKLFNITLGPTTPGYGFAVYDCAW